MATKEKEVTKTELTLKELEALGIKVDEAVAELIEKPEDQDEKEEATNGTTESKDI
jgi:hypothetical protein